MMPELPNILISACLTGKNCKYNGGNNALPEDQLEQLRQRYHLIPVCPEQMGGLPTPRPPAELCGEKVLNREGEDVTDSFRNGAAMTLALAEEVQAGQAILKSRSPSCGKGPVYDGTFRGVLTEGSGVTASILRDHGIRIWTEQEIGKLLD